VKEEKGPEALPSIFRPAGQDNWHSLQESYRRPGQQERGCYALKEWWSVKNGQRAFLRLLSRLASREIRLY